MKYPKINSLWKRTENPGWVSDKKRELIPGDYSCEEFGNIKKWLVQEKIDGMNIRVKYTQKSLSESWANISVVFDGRTDLAQIPTKLYEHLQVKFAAQAPINIFDVEKIKNEDAIITLFGEGYGPKIQAGGGNYRSDQGFILFDVNINGRWLKQEDVKNIADKLDVPYAPIIGIMAEEEIVEYVKSKPLSNCSIAPQVIEGVICRPQPLVLCRNGERIIFKLKCKDMK